MNLPSSSTDQSKRHKLLFVTYGLVLLVFTVVLLELASWVVLKKTDQGESTYNGKRHLYHPYRSHQLNPDYKRDFDSSGNLLHSSDGFRGDQVYSKNKPENTFRILMMGGSTLYGVSAAPPYERHPSLNNDETISYFLQQHLHNKIKETEADVTIEIINAAVTAYTTFHHLVYFNEVLFEYKPDLIIFLDGHNDFYYSEVYNNWQSYRQGTIRLVDHYNQRGFWFTSHTVVRYLARFSRFFWLLETFMHRNWEPTGEPVFSQQDIPKELAGEFPDNMDTVLDETIFKTLK